MGGMILKVYTLAELSMDSQCHQHCLVLAGGRHTVLWAWASALRSQINLQLSPVNIIIIIYLLL